jgi:ferredoxin
MRGSQRGTSRRRHLRSTARNTTLLHGCDICREVCPWNISFSTALREPALAPQTLFHDVGHEAIAEDSEAAQKSRASQSRSIRTARSLVPLDRLATEGADYEKLSTAIAFHLTDLAHFTHTSQRNPLYGVTGALFDAAANPNHPARTRLGMVEGTRRRRSVRCPQL